MMGLAACAAEVRPDPLASVRTPAPVVTEIGSGVWCVRFGAPEKFTPDTMREAPPRLDDLRRLPESGALPFALDQIRCRLTTSGCTVYVPCDEPESEIYGFGLDPTAYRQKGLRKYLTVCAGVIGRTGASHGPVPFYVSTRGYGVYVDTARVPWVHVARLTAKDAVSADRGAGTLKTSEKELYAARPAAGKGEVIFDLPGNPSGVDVFVFGGPGMKGAVQRYNLFAGGGAVPPLWGLGLKYRMHAEANRDRVLEVAKALRSNAIPCDVLGLEPGWQTHAYSCSLKWSDERFPRHREMTDELRELGFRINLWEHAYIHPTSPLFEPLKLRSGDFLVWGGLVVDFADPVAFKIYGDYHGRELIDCGIDGFKADECDNQPLDDGTPFNYPYFTAFPSGIAGEQMTQLYGTLQQRSLLAQFKTRNRRTWGDARATSALASPLPFNLYSDAYGFGEYLRQTVNASFAGLLWSPEVRDARSFDELMNRIALASFAPQMCFNLWYLPHPLWEQFDREKNKAGQLLPPPERERAAARIRAAVGRRYELLPYLYAAFHRYRNEGVPPVRALVLDFPDDPAVRGIDTAFMFGDALLVAPFLDGERARRVYLPKGTDWFDFERGRRYAGGSTVEFSGEAGVAPLFVRNNALVPVATPVPFVGRDTAFDIAVRVFGDRPAPFVLVEDDGETDDYTRGALNRVTLRWSAAEGGRVERAGGFKVERYRINCWEPVAAK